MKSKDAVILAAGLGGWKVVAIGSETVVLSVPCSANWVAMIHNSIQDDSITISIRFGHPQLGTREGNEVTVEASETLAADIWSKVRANVSGIPFQCQVPSYSVLYGETFVSLLRLASYYAFWPRKPTLSRSKEGIWKVTDGRIIVFVSCLRGDLYVNATNVGAYNTRHWLGTEPQDAIFFQLCRAIQNERSARARSATAQAYREDGPG